MARSLPGVGTVLVTAKGYALYSFAPDNHHAVTCAGACAGRLPAAPLGPPLRDCQQFGGGEFTAMVGRVAGIEQHLGSYDLTQFTPQVSQYLPHV